MHVTCLAIPTINDKNESRYNEIWGTVSLAKKKKKKMAKYIQMEAQPRKQGLIT